MLSHHASAESTFQPSGDPASIVCRLILQKILNFHSLGGELSQSVSGQLKRKAKGTCSGKRSSVGASSSGVAVVDWCSNWKVKENRSCSSEMSFPQQLWCSRLSKESSAVYHGSLQEGWGVVVWGPQAGGGENAVIQLRWGQSGAICRQGSDSSFLLLQSGSASLGD